MIIHYCQRSKLEFYPVDPNGFLKPPVNSINEIDPINEIILNEIIRECKRLFRKDLVGVYFRGSQLLNANFSDFDVVIVTENLGIWSSYNLSRHFDVKFGTQFYHIKNFDAVLLDHNQVKMQRDLQFIVKVLSVHVYGVEIEKDIADFRPTNEIAFLQHKFNAKWAHVRTLIGEGDGTQLKAMVNFMVKYFIRCAYELVLEREGRYTRELDLCHQVFSKYYPEYEHYSESILSYYDKKSFLKMEFVNDANVFCELLNAEFLKLDIYHGN